MPAAWTRYARGLMESQVVTDFRILGTVAEGDTIRHVVYRETTDHMGLVIEAAPTTMLVLEEGGGSARTRSWESDSPGRRNSRTQIQSPDTARAV